MAISCKGAHCPPDIMLMGVRWALAYPLRYRHIEGLLAERGVPSDHATIQRGVVKASPLLEEVFHRRKRALWVSWRMDETSIKIKGQCRTSIVPSIRSGRQSMSCGQHNVTNRPRNAS
jgi:putative transposase